MLLIAIRALILYTLLVAVMRLMGKRQIGQLQPFELVIVIVIAELAVIPMSNTGIPLLNGIVGILVLMAAQILISMLILYSERARAIICGKPVILINNGKPVREMLHRVRINMDDLYSYERERREVLENTLQFLKGYQANNVLLYGDRGTGKSSTVKALVNEYHGKGLRIIEVPKGYLSDFPEIIRLLRGRSQKFIIFVDDLTFDDSTANYTALKAVLEGGLESRPSNVVIYATSNRRHLVKERFSDRPDSLDTDEIHKNDSVQEKLSLADRFGITVIFTAPDQERYLEIASALAEQRGLQVQQNILKKEALKWANRHNGRSPRTARQFIDWLEGHLAIAKK
jgi:predicted AAA+ superfamily ATPase